MQQNACPRSGKLTYRQRELIDPVATSIQVPQQRTLGESGGKGRDLVVRKGKPNRSKYHGHSCTPGVYPLCGCPCIPKG